MMTKDPNIPTVRLKDLVPDRCNFKDKTFESFVSDFMSRQMPGFPLGLLGTSSSEAMERWQIEPEDRYVVEGVDLWVYICCECGEEYPTEPQVEEPPVCCPLEALAAQEDDKPEIFDLEERAWFLIRDNHYVQPSFTDRGGDSTIQLPTGEDTEAWYEKKDAQQFADELNWESMRENSHGFPWANSWCFMPEDHIETQDLKDAGFTVAQYCGGEGNWSGDMDYRLAGIDGGGYSFPGAHFAPLCALHHERHNWPVETDNGRAYIEGE
tara:strand:+ start:102 stop:902 length:801 start_codon:yes stop_codon:yes gene_type:complete